MTRWQTRRSRHFVTERTKEQTISNLGNTRHWQSLFDALADNLAHINGKTLEDKLVNVEAEAPVDTMGHRLALVQMTSKHSWRSRDVTKHFPRLKHWIHIG